MNDIGQKLKEIREQKGFPQKLIASILGVNRSNYSKIENNHQKLTAEQLQMFCHYCEVSADYILGTPGPDKVFSIQRMDDINKKLDELKDAINK